MMSRKKNFTLLELLITMGIIGILAGLTGAALSRSRAMAKRIACINNLRQIGLAINTYSINNEMRFPNAVSLPSFALQQGEPAIRLCDILFSNVGHSLKVFHCPADSASPSWFDKEGSSYEFNGKLSGEKMDSFHEIVKHGASKVVVVFDYDCFHAVLPQPRVKNYLFADGHIGDAE